MNKKLTEEIIHHVFSNLGIFPSTFINVNKTQSLLDKQFLLPEKLSFDNDGQIINKNIFGCQILVTDSKDFKILLVDCTQDDLLEYFLLVQLKDSPAFGMHMIFNHLNQDIDSEVLLAVSADKQHWMPCSTYLQATFLAGMEQLKDLGFNWGKCNSYQEQYQQLLSFIKFFNKFYEVDDEGKES